MKLRDHYLTITDAAALLGVTPATLSDKARRGTIPCDSSLGIYVFRREDLTAYQQRREQRRRGHHA